MCLRLGLALAVLAAGAAGPAFAAGDNVLVVTPTSVELPRALPGDCKVRARVLEVMAGSAYRRGERIAIQVPCSDRKPAFDDRPATRLPPGARPGPTPVDPVVLRRSSRGYVHIDDEGRLIWTPTARPYGSYGVAWGYRVLDGVKLPADKTAA